MCEMQMQRSYVHAYARQAVCKTDMAQSHLTDHVTFAQMPVEKVSNTTNMPGLPMCASDGTIVAHAGCYTCIVTLQTNAVWSVR